MTTLDRLMIGGALFCLLLIVSWHELDVTEHAQRLTALEAQLRLRDFAPSDLSSPSSNHHTPPAPARAPQTPAGASVDPAKETEA